MCITIQTLATFLGSQPLLFKNFRPFPAPQGVRQLDQIPLGPSSPNRVDPWKNPFKPSSGCLPSKNPKNKMVIFAVLRSTTRGKGLFGPDAILSTMKPLSKGLLQEEFEGLDCWIQAIVSAN